MIAVGVKSQSIPLVNLGEIIFLIVIIMRALCIQAIVNELISYFRCKLI